MSARVARDTRTILQKAQQFKETQDMGDRKDYGKKNTPFSLFSNPNFLSVAENIGVDVDIDVEVKKNVAKIKYVLTW